jgi:hypothetical protein
VHERKLRKGYARREIDGGKMGWFGEPRIDGREAWREREKRGGL